uniref:EF-hand domain-containing protein n=1 Tax=Plectus sambesii TaxID=2011161 RepID=A0A914XL83_9BILA
MYANISFVRSPSPTAIKIRSPIPQPSKEITGVAGYFYRLLFFTFYRLKSSLCYTTVYIDCEMDDREPSAHRHQPESLEWMVKNTRFTKRELQAFYRGFKQENPHGYMTLDQVKSIFSSIFVHGNSEQYATFVFQSFNRTLPDQITFLEFAVALSRLLRGTLDEKLEWIFTLYDQKGDGVITFDEMFGMVTALYNNMGMMVDPPPDRFAIRQHARDMFQIADRRPLVDRCVRRPPPTLPGHIQPTHPHCSMALNYRSIFYITLLMFFVASVYNFMALMFVADKMMERTTILHANRVQPTAQEGDGWGTARKGSREMMDDDLLELPNRHDLLESEELEELEDEPEPIDDVPPEPEIFFDGETEWLFIKTTANRPDDCRTFRHRIQQGQFRGTWPSEWEKCGRKPNAHATLTDGTMVCLRYRHPHDFLVAGEILSLELARVMGLKNVPCATLLSVQPAERWHGNLEKIGWNTKTDTVVAAVEWIPDLHQRKPLPATVLHFLNKPQGSDRLNTRQLSNLTANEIFEIAQWSDMFVFDYLTGHYDRFASLQDDAELQNQSSILEGRVRNAAFDKQNVLWLFDNEAGMLDAYMLLFEPSNGRPSNYLRFQQFHKRTLASLCIFRKSTVQRVSRMLTQTDPVATLMEAVNAAEPLMKQLNVEAEPRFRYLQENFKQRLIDVVAHWKWCADNSR